MSDGLNIVIVSGNLSRDPELRFGQGGADSAVLKFSVAANESYFDKKSNERKESVEFIDCTVFGKRAEALQKILTKGSHVTVRGKWHTSSWEKDGQKRYRTECVVDNVVLGGRSNGGGSGSGGGRSSAPKTEKPNFTDDGGAPDGADDDIPF